MQESVITTKGQTTLPKEIRSALDIKPGDRLRYVIQGDQVRLLKARPSADLLGLLKGKVGKPLSLENMDEIIAEGAVASGKPTA